MKQFNYFLILFVWSISSCGPSYEEKLAMENCMLEELAIEDSIFKSTQHYFDAECPGRNRKLSNLIGDTLIIEDVCGGFIYPLEMKITSTSKNNTITNIRTGKVLFSGKVCKHRDTYYLSERINDTSYKIYTILFAENKIIGFPLYKQLGKIDSLLNSGSLKGLQTKTTFKRLHPTKREIRKLFTPIIAYSTALEIINNEAILDQVGENEPTSSIENDAYDLISAFYPNPVKDILNVELTSPDKHKYELIDINGRTVLKGTFNALLNKLEMAHLNAGNYSLIIQNSLTQQVETIKIVKQN